MKKLHLDLENCYGIRTLKADFDFSANGRVFTIYAPNGVMKTSLANTFGDLVKGEQSSDRIWPQKTTKRIIVDETGAELPKEAVFVIEPYNEAYRSGRLSTLLVNETLRRRYLEVHAIIDEKTDLLIDALKPKTGLKTSLKESLAVSITHDPKDFFRALIRIKEEVFEGTDSTLGDVIYSDIFNPKVEAILNDPEFRNSVENYVKKYDELLTRSTFFRKGVFTHNNAADVAKALSANGFFKADHSVYLRIDGEKKEVSTLAELEKAIQSEKDRILTDEKLKNAFEKIDKQLVKNVELKKFRACLEEHPAIVTELSNPERLRQKLWVAYLIKSKEQFEEVLRVYNEGKAKIAEIVEEASNERTRWAQVIHIFNERFSVPFVVRMDN
jgi:hypothetical protein